MEKLILVDLQDNVLGECEKIKAHQDALCHRAFSVFVFRQNNHTWELLLQQRHQGKYHCGGLWTNTCCGHPRPGETTVSAAERRLHEEMGFKVALHEVRVFHYTAKLDTGLTENEVDHVLIGFYKDETIAPNDKEIEQYRWDSIETIDEQLVKAHDAHTPWFQEAYEYARAALELGNTTNRWKQ